MKYLKRLFKESEKNSEKGKDTKNGGFRGADEHNQWRKLKQIQRSLLKPV